MVMSYRDGGCSVGRLCRPLVIWDGLGCGYPLGDEENRGARPGVW